MDPTIDTSDDYIVIKLIPNKKAQEEVVAYYDAWDDHFDFYYSTHKQICDVIFSHDYDNNSRILKTPRRVSKRRNKASVSFANTSRRVSKRKISSAVKTPELFHSPRRVSKGPKLSTPQKAVVQQVIDGSDNGLEVGENKTQLQTNAVPLELFSELSISETEDKMEVNDTVDYTVDETVENEDKVEIQVNGNVEEIDETNLEIDVNLENDNNDKKAEIIETVESDKEWMTDDEDGEEKMETEEFFDAIEVKNKLEKSVTNETKKTGVKCLPKKKKKVSQYFTPQTSHNTRTHSRIATLSRVDSQTTPSNQKLRSVTGQTGSKTSVIAKQIEANITSSAESNSQRGGSTARSLRYYSRVQKTDQKSLTASAAKRRQEQEELRRQRLAEAQEKEKKALEKREILIKQKVDEKKLKSQEKFRRAEEQRVIMKQMEAERLAKEQEKREEHERKRKALEEERRDILKKKQEELAKKNLEKERRKQMQEMNEILVKLQKQEEMSKKQELENIRKQQELKITAMIQHHNNSLQQKTVSQSTLKKPELLPKLVLTKISPELIKEKTEPNVIEENVKQENNTNSTFVVPKGNSNETSVYDITPPPVEHEYNNYDISQIQSEDDTDDEDQPRKRIPGWARGQQFAESLQKQFNVSKREREKLIKKLFSKGIPMPVDLGLIFGPMRSVHAKYSKRTSSAVWNSPPALNMSVSFNSTQSDLN